LPPKLGAFIQKYPAVRPILRIGDSAGVIEDVVDGKVELGYVGFKAVDARLVFETIWKDEMVLAIPKGHSWAARNAVELSALQFEKFVSRETGSGTLDSFRGLLADRGEAADKVLNVAMQLGSTEAVKQALLAGFGVSILSRTSIRRELAEGVLIEVPIEGFKMERDFYEVIYRQRPLSPAAQAFRQFLQMP
jgi:DNA-binding transcriptional LysR family regulator